MHDFAPAPLVGPPARRGAGWIAVCLVLLGTPFSGACDGDDTCTIDKCRVQDSGAYFCATGQHSQLETCCTGKTFQGPVTACRPSDEECFIFATSCIPERWARGHGADTGANADARLDAGYDAAPAAGEAGMDANRGQAD